MSTLSSVYCISCDKLITIKIHKNSERKSMRIILIRDSSWEIDYTQGDIGITPIEDNKRMVKVIWTRATKATGSTIDESSSHCF